jgi:hypothetical protein
MAKVRDTDAAGYPVGTVYELIDPRNGQCRYVGCTMNLEQRSRYHTAINGWGFGDNNKKYNRWRQELWDVGKLQPAMQVIEDSVRRDKLRDRELFWVRDRVEKGCDLVNLPSGKITKGDLFPASDAMICADFADQIVELVDLIGERLEHRQWPGSNAYDCIPTEAGKQMRKLREAAHLFRCYIGG